MICRGRCGDRLQPVRPAKAGPHTVLLLAFILLSGCRTIRHVPEGTPLTSLTSSNASDAAQQLAARRSQFRGERSLIRLRLPNGVSARAQLQVDPSLRMMLTVYTPIGTTAARLYSAAGD
ncbi:MAG: hypothetical protein DMF57_13845, partial [Acidobacteria bacterium]